MDEPSESAGNSAPSAQKRVVGRPFPKGVSGNPKGRPKTCQEFKEACARKSVLALNCLTKEIKTGGEYRTRAAEILLAYAHGKPSQKLEHTGEDGGPLKIVVQKYGEEDAE